MQTNSIENDIRFVNIKNRVIEKVFLSALSYCCYSFCTVLFLLVLSRIKRILLRTNFNCPNSLLHSTAA